MVKFVAICVALIVLLFVIQLLYCTVLVPNFDSRPFRPSQLDRYVGLVAYVIADVLGIIRLPLAIIPYSFKLFIMLVVKPSTDIIHSEAIRLVGDFVNLGITIILLNFLIGPPELYRASFVFYMPVTAELVRLIFERGQMAASGIWQIIPHRTLARFFSHTGTNWLTRVLANYCRYYCLSDEKRAGYVLSVLKYRAMGDANVSNRLEYMRAFHIVSHNRPLIRGKVRDVARGEVLINRSWTNDPWLLVGMALRRSPWVFDPRYLHRPFYYRSESCCLVTLFILQHVRYSPTFAIYQFGHQIKEARYAIFFRSLRFLGVDVEQLVREDGVHGFDPLLHWIERQVASRKSAVVVTCPLRPLWSDDEAIFDILRRLNAGGSMTSFDIAIRYTYPAKYVEEVLWPKVSALRLNMSLN